MKFLHYKFLWKKPFDEFLSNFNPILFVVIEIVELELIQVVSFVFG